MTMPQPTSSIDDDAWANAERGHRAQRWASTTMLAGALQRAAVLGSRADSFSPPSARVKGGPKNCYRTRVNQKMSQNSAHTN
jgi:hypothetical protein